MKDKKLTCEDCMFSVFLVDEETWFCRASRAEIEDSFPCEIFFQETGNCVNDDDDE